MFDIGMSEILVIAVVAIVVVGPKDLPKLLRTVGKTISGVKRMAGDFQQQFNDAIEETDLGDIKNIATGKPYNPLDSIKEAANEVKNDINNGLNDTSKDADSGDVEPLFPENETSKRLAAAATKESSAKASSATKSGAADSGKKTVAKKSTAKKTTAKKSGKKPVKPVKAKALAKKTPAKPSVKKSAQTKTKTKSKSAAT